MSTDPSAGDQGGQVPPEAAEAGIDEAELRRLEEQIREIKVQDLLAQSVASVVNLTARRIAKEDERDLEQARVGIEAVRAWVDLLPPEVGPSVREALSQLQLLYAQASQPEEGGGQDPRGGPGGQPGGPGGDQPGGGGGQPPSKLWTPGP